MTDVAKRAAAKLFFGGWTGNDYGNDELLFLF